VVIACCSFYKASAVKPRALRPKKQVLEHCRDYLKVPGPGPSPAPTLPAKDSDCCEKVREVTVWKELLDCLTREDKLYYMMSRIKSLPHACKPYGILDICVVNKLDETSISSIMYGRYFICYMKK
jgi:hypothetical protein